jgi:hypothetical protein
VVERLLARVLHVVAPGEAGAHELRIPDCTVTRQVAPRHIPVCSTSKCGLPSGSSVLPLRRCNQRRRDGIVLEQIAALFERRCTSASPRILAI